MIDFFRLPRGVTNGDTRVEVGVSKAACYGAARERDLEVKEVWRRGESKTSAKTLTYDTYHAALLAGPEGGVWALRHAHTPLLAFVRELTPFSKRFLDLPLLAEPFAQAFFHPLPAAYLNQTLIKTAEADVLALLDETERSTVRHWSPDKVGDVLFNEWD